MNRQEFEIYSLTKMVNTSQRLKSWESQLAAQQRQAMSATEMQMRAAQQHAQLAAQQAIGCFGFKTTLSALAMANTASLKTPWQTYRSRYMRAIEKMLNPGELTALRIKAVMAEASESTLSEGTLKEQARLMDEWVSNPGDYWKMYCAVRTLRTIESEVYFGEKLEVA